MKINWPIVIFLTVFGLLFVGMFMALAYDQVDRLNTRYIMPNEVICKDRYVPNGGIEFSKCDDGNKYINPDFYNTRTLKNKYTFWDAILGADE